MLIYFGDLVKEFCEEFCHQVNQDLDSLPVEGRMSVGELLGEKAALVALSENSSENQAGGTSGAVPKESSSREVFLPRCKFRLSPTRRRALDERPDSQDPENY